MRPCISKETKNNKRVYLFIYREKFGRSIYTREYFGHGVHLDGISCKDGFVHWKEKKEENVYR